MLNSFTKGVPYLQGGGTWSVLHYSDWFRPSQHKLEVTKIHWNMIIWWRMHLHQINIFLVVWLVVKWVNGQTWKCQFLYTIPILGIIILPQKVRYFWQYQIWNKAEKAKNTMNQLKIIQIHWKYNLISLRIP